MLFDLTTISDSTLIVFGTFILHQLVFWITNSIILLITYVLYPEKSKKFKIQKVEQFSFSFDFLYWSKLIKITMLFLFLQDIQIDIKNLKECATTVLINQVFVLLPLLFIVCPIFLHFNLRWHLPFPSWFVFRLFTLN